MTSLLSLSCVTAVLSASSTGHDVSESQQPRQPDYLGHWEGLDLGGTVRSAHEASKNRTGGALGGIGPGKDGQECP